jgi:transposase
MQKALNIMNLKLTNVVSDITGVTGLKIIRDIVAGEHDPKTLAHHRDFRCKKSQDEIAKSLQGNYRAEHIFELRQALELFDFYNQKIKACDAEIEGLYAAFEPQVDIVDKPLPPKKQKHRKPRGNEPYFDLHTYLYQMTGVDLTQIDGINALTAQTVVSEIGLAMSKCTLALGSVSLQTIKSPVAKSFAALPREPLTALLKPCECPPLL